MPAAGATRGRRVLEYAGGDPASGTDLASENARLRRENERLRMERVIQKTMRIFSQAPR
jgi:transposase-like protein